MNEFTKVRSCRKLQKLRHVRAACVWAVSIFHVAEHGTGDRDLLLIHGIGSRSVSWWPVIDRLSEHFRLIVPDLRGHGDSDKPASG